MIQVKLTEDLNSIVGRLVGGEYDNDKNAKNDLLRVVDSVKVQSSKPKEAELTIDIDFAAYLSEATAMNVRLATEIEKLKQSIADFSGVSESICRSTLIKKSGGAHCFSKENKAPEIELSSNQTEAKKITHNLPRLVLCESPLRNGLNKSVFKIKKHSNLIAIGVGLQSKIKERSFCFDGMGFLTQDHCWDTVLTWSRATAWYTPIRKPMRTLSRRGSASIPTT